MELKLQRKSEAEKATLGDIFINGEWFGVTLEDIHQDFKVKHHTRIPTGRYKINQRKALSSMTKTYRSKYNWFDWHLELQGVEDFDNVYLHIGNKPADTSGCILIASSQTFGKGFIGSSTDRFKDFYLKVREALIRGEEVWIEVRDEYYKQQPEKFQ